VTLDVIGAIDAWDAERWLVEGRLLAYLASGRVVGLASIGGALAPEVARQLLSMDASIAEVSAAGW
jgi:hypothetical protein